MGLWTICLAENSTRNCGGVVGWIYGRHDLFSGSWPIAEPASVRSEKSGVGRRQKSQIAVPTRHRALSRAFR